MTCRCTYTYNRRGQVTSVLESGHANPTTHTYGPHGERLVTKTPKGAATAFAYDEVGRLTSVTGPEGRRTTFAYDRVGTSPGSPSPSTTAGP